MAQPVPGFEIEKTLWTENDFETMGWHDSMIYAITFNPDFEFIIDIDYIFKWVHPQEGETHFKFWVSPCTLVFENVYDLKINIEISTPFELEIDDITRSNPQTPKNGDFINRDTEYDWTIETQQGSITFKSIGFKQFVRQKPVFSNSQQIDIDKRGGISFGREIV